MRRRRWRLHVQKGERQDYARGGIYLCLTLQEREFGDEWVEDNRLQGPEEACDCVRDNAYSTTVAHNLCHRFAVNFYRGTRFLTKKEEKRFPKEQKILAIESSEETDEKDDVQPKEPPQRTACGSVQVDVLVIRVQQERRLAKRWKIIVDIGEGQRLESRMTETQVTGIRSSKI
ncbi:hypothetical protein AXG93_4719s1000 [Marchantia polymorpha subsp. ruderalis]|uniref:Uncharacterized protein n=1 Tax=Marchantia polymorpha subsp. ruderalis TaxID=1480154 RepID=A0A176VSS1_MARPO|nr:hypothetical protein AXG93_4719s1000 [Marchantia polymorpha subsp. ruderalis]